MAYGCQRQKVWYQNVGTVANGSSNLIVEGHEMNEYYMMNPYKGNGSYFNSDGTVNINGERRRNDPY